MTNSEDSKGKISLQGAVAVLLGGKSAEREVSLQSGTAVLEALLALGIDAIAVDTADSDWLMRVSDDFAHVFIALHGGEGEDGTVQGALESLGLSYTGSDVLASALAMDKLRTKHMWLGMGLPTPDFCLLNRETDFEALMQNWDEAIVKPASEGSSIGMARVESAEQLREAFLKALDYDDVVIAEQWISGAEFTVTIIGDRALAPIRLETDSHFYDYEAKYISGDTRYICPCGLSDEKIDELQRLSKEAFDSIGCRGWGRVDVMQNSAGGFLLLEVNTVPGMTSHSLVPMAAKAEGLSFEALVAEILSLSVIEKK